MTLGVTERAHWSWRRDESVRKPPARAPRLRDKLLAMFTAIVRHFRAWKRYDNAMHELSYLTDRELADIGICRCDIPRLAREHSIAEMAIPAGADRRDHINVLSLGPNPGHPFL